MSKFIPYEPLASNVPITARLRSRIDRWRAIGAEQFVLSMVENGLWLAFRRSRPPPPRPGAPTYRGLPAAERDLHRQLAEWRASGVIETDSTSPEQRIRSLLFPVPKRQSPEFRWCHDGRFVNQSLRQRRIRFETIDSVRNLLQPGDYLTSIDLKSAYQHVVIRKDHRKYFGFSALGQSLRFAAMPFGLSTAPWAFTRLMRAVMAYLRRFGIRVSIYLDDLLIMASSKALAFEHTRKVRELLETLGFVLNLEKSVFVPSRTIRHLGLMIDTRRWRLFLPHEKVIALAKDARRVLRLHDDNKLTVRALAGLVGKMVAASPAMRDLRFRFRSLQRCVWFALRHGRQWDGTVALSRTAMRDVRWLLIKQALKRSNGAPINLDDVDARLTTDASETGYGALLQIGERRLVMHARWSADESIRSSNWRETTAVTRAVMSFRRLLRPLRSLLIESDNTTAVSTLRRFGSRHRHLGLAIEPTLRFLMRHRIDLLARHLPGVQNRVADALSRFLPSRNDWTLERATYDQILLRFPRPTFDFFASTAAHLCSRFATRSHDPMATAVDAFSCDWAAEFGLYVPPFNLLPRVLRRIQALGAHGIVIVPEWPSRPWFGVLSTMAQAWMRLPDTACVPAPHTEVLPGRPPPRLLAVLL